MREMCSPMTVLGGTCLLVLGGDVSGVPFISSSPNAGEIRKVSWQAILHIGKYPAPTDHKRRGSVAVCEACFC